MLQDLVGLMQQCFDWCHQPSAGRPARGRKTQGCQIEVLESRQLLSASGSGEVLFSASDTRLVTPRIVNGTPTDGFDSVALVGNRLRNNGSGTLIAPQWILTAAHLSVGLGDTDGRVTIGGMTYTTEKIIVHPNYNGKRLNSNKANDLALWKLSEPVVGVDPSPIYRQKPRVGSLLTLVGYGSGGTFQGETGDFGTKRVGTTPLQKVTSTRIRWVFNSPEEANTGHGDSGGPAYIQVGDTYYVAGITSGGTRYNAGRGDRAFDTRVDVFQDWIDNEMNDGLSNGRLPRGRRALQRSMSQS